MHIDDIEAQPRNFSQDPQSRTAKLPKFQELVTVDDMEMVENQQPLDLTAIQKLNHLKVEKKLYEGPKSNVLLCRNLSTGELEVLKWTKNQKNGCGASIHLTYQTQFYRKVNQTPVSRLVKINSILKTQTGCIRSMKYACRGDLTSFIPTQNLTRAQKQTHLKVVKNILWQVLNGLQQIHKLGYAYRDLKPTNVIIDHDGKALLCDFGLVAQLGVIDPSICGTPEYMPPERLSEKRMKDPIKASIDFWSLGILAFELLMGYTPFEYEDMNFSALLESMYEGSLSFDEQYPQNCRHLIFNLMQTNISRRFKIEDIKAHQFFQGVEQQPLLKQGCRCIQASRI